MTNSSVQFCPESEAARLRGLYGHLSGLELLDALVQNELKGQIMLSSSFGAESAVLLDLVAQVDPAIPVIFLDTRRLFGETLRYQKTLTNYLGLEDVRIIRPDDGVLLRLDPDDMLFNEDPDKCCHIRKVAPLDNIMNKMGNLGYKAWITGRKQFQTATRTALPMIEAEADFIKINPLADWSNDDIKQAYLAKNLPPHPLVADGFKSIGCMPCTSRVAEGADPRSGRWAGRDKTECGIHLPKRPDVTTII
ncbi:phosphoadenylyl-sulfate reductase [Sneathiella sp.]|uniref:phosphoadenylyl-sulfate reductase n=1 Tax=Sneathiella sp. TaxID=1964365 RepID=UPI00261DB0C9|nr:phosphoadenylyl-sulfate reductase [Sneathiella sp.]MDF2367060.1 phosphoadenylyl-sulfate reductase [Sneathiella sp.]